MRSFYILFLAIMLSTLAFGIGFLIFEKIKLRRKKALAEPHLKLLKDSHPEVRVQAAQALGKIGHVPSALQLSGTLADPDPSVRIAAIEALGKLESRDSLGSLVHVVIHDEATSVRIAALKALQVIGKSYMATIDRISMLNSTVVTRYAEDLQERLNTYILPGVMLALNDEDTGIREASALALQQLGESKNLEALLQSRVSKADDVQYSAFYPPTVMPESWDALFIYAHLQGSEVKMENDLQNLANWIGENIFRSKTTKQISRLRHGTRVTVVLESDEAQFSPASLTRIWKGKQVRFKFRFKPIPGIAAKSLSLRASIQVQGVEIAHLKFSLKLEREQTHPVVLGRKIENPLAKAKLDSQTSAIYQKIFVSYSRRDREVVEAYRFAQLALGNDVFMDTYSIRSGEDWRAALARAIDTADVFQLFWSKDSAASTNVRDEWDYALTYKCPQTHCVDFIRPVFWVEPMPVPPPPELSHLNFKYVPLKERFKPAERQA